MIAAASDVRRALFLPNMVKNGARTLRAEITFLFTDPGILPYMERHLGRGSRQLEIS